MFEGESWKAIVEMRGREEGSIIPPSVPILGQEKVPEYYDEDCQNGSEVLLHRGAFVVLAAHGDAPGVREPADEHDGGDGGGHHQRRALPGQVGDARLHRETGTR